MLFRSHQNTHDQGNGKDSSGHADGPLGNVCGTVVRGNPQDTAKYIAERISDATGVLCFDEYKNMFPNCIVECFGSKDDLGAQAREVFDRLRAFDDTSVTQIWAQCPSDEGLGLAVANRIKKAAGFSVIEI